MQRTRLSSKGQIILPKSIRDSRSWKAGMEFTIEPAENGVILRPAPLFPHTEIGDVAGCLASRRTLTAPGPEQNAIDNEVRRRHDSGRY